MKGRIFYVLFLTLAMFSIIACKKKMTTTDTAPKISNLDVSPQNMVEFVDSVEISFDYRDLEGNIGDEDPNKKSLKVKDSRLNTPDFYHILPLTPRDKDYDIKGRLIVKLNSMFTLGNVGSEKFTLTVSLQDNAGNFSNELVSDSLQVVK